LGACSRVTVAPRLLEVKPGSALSTWLADGEAVAALVRPDFTVMRVGHDLATLCEGAPTFLQRQDPLAQPSTATWFPRVTTPNTAAATTLLARHADADTVDVRTPITVAGESAPATPRDAEPDTL
jgi:hypothetical protein